MTYLLIAIFLAVIVLLYLPDEPSCRKHGTKYMYCHGYDRNWDCSECWKENRK